MAPCFYRCVDHDYAAIAIRTKGGGHVVAETVVDIASIPVIKRHGEVWYASAKGFVIGFSKITGTRVYLHRVLVPRSSLVRHKNHNRLDNRLTNLVRTV